MKILYLRVLCLCIFLASSVPAFAQDNTYIKNKIKLPPSPNAAALGKYGEVPVSKFTGMANIGVPLFEVKSGSITVPINLSYHNSGFKVDERASWTGAGWTINAGGVITRVIQGLPDEMPTGYDNVLGLGGAINLPDPVSDHTNFAAFPANLTESQKRNLANRYWDGIQDAYYFNFMGRSGKFIITKSGIRAVPYQELKIEKTANVWTIVDETGFKYTFGISEDRNGIETTEYDDTDGVPGSPIIPVSNTAWYLVDIISPNGDIVKFEYAAEGIGVMGQESQTQLYFLGDTEGINDGTCDQVSTNPISQPTYLNINGKRLSKIKFLGGEVEFVANTLRKDVYYGDEVKRLDQLILKNSTGDAIKKFVFDYSYLGQSDINTSLQIFNRLLLSSVTEANSNGTLNKPYQFVYNLGSIPSSKSYSIDHWGYYNGKMNGTSLIPSFLNNNDILFNTLSSREPDPAVSAVGLLTKIIYPTGGFSEFSYEPHSYSNINGGPIPVEYQKIQQTATATVNNPSNGANVLNEQITAFTIQEAQQVSLQYQIDRANFNGLGDYYVSLYKTGESLPVFTYSGENTDFQETFLGLDAGSYTLIAHIEDKGYYAYISVKHFSYDYNQPIINKYAGGFRIKQIVDDNGAINSNRETTNYVYDLLEDGTRSSGILGAAPSYEYYTKRLGIKRPQSPGPTGQIHYYSCKFLARTSNSTAPLGAADGGIVTYSQVKTFKNSGENGSSRSWFTSANEFYDQIFNGAPFAPTRSLSFKRGLLKQEILYDKDGREMQKVVNDYEYNSSTSSPNITGEGNLTVIFDDYFPLESGSPITTYLSLIYDNRSEWQYLKKTIKTDYSYTSVGTPSSLVTVTDYIYNNPLHAQLTETVVTNSKGQLLSGVNRYPHEMVALGKTVPYQEMINRHMFAPVIEQEQRLNSVKQTKQMTTFKMGWTPATTLILPDSLNTQFKNETTEARLQYLQYDDKGNPLSITQDKGTKICYVWGYGKSFPIAEISNADYATVETILGGSSAISTFGNILQPTDSQVATFVAPLRTAISLKDASITTITYKPLVGVTSQTDAKGMTTYYEYDEFQRLKATKDQNGHVIKSYDYHYKP